MITGQDLRDAFNFASAGNRGEYSGAGCVAPGQSVPVSDEVFFISDEPYRFKPLTLDDYFERAFKRSFGGFNTFTTNQQGVKPMTDLVSIAKQMQAEINKKNTEAAKPEIKWHGVYVNGVVQHVSPNEKGALKFAAKLIEKRLDSDEENQYGIYVIPVSINSNRF